MVPPSKPRKPRCRDYRLGMPPRSTGFPRADAQAGFLRVACDRYRRLRTHEWSAAVLARLRAAM
jgi:hypothetical protein